MSFQLSPSILDPARLRTEFTSPHAGAFICFEGRVRDDNGGRSVVALNYEAYEPLCHIEMEKILNETQDRFKVIDIKTVHRVGKLKVEDLAVWAGVLAVHRDDAFLACRYIIDELKTRLPIWKKEYYSDGSSQWTSCMEHAHGK